jgi:hypothetical protein
MGAGGLRDEQLIGVARHTENETILVLREDVDEIVATPGPPQARTWIDDRARLAADDPIAGRWRHFKGAIYDFIGRARDMATGEMLVISTSADGRVWLRPERMIDELVDGEECGVPRFSRETPT